MKKLNENFGPDVAIFDETIKKLRNILKFWIKF